MTTQTQIQELNEHLYHLKIEHEFLLQNLALFVRVDDALKDVKELKNRLKDITDILKGLKSWK